MKCHIAAKLEAEECLCGNSRWNCGKLPLQGRALHQQYFVMRCYMEEVAMKLAEAEKDE